jgi:hypothetical protein
MGTEKREEISGRGFAHRDEWDEGDRAEKLKGKRQNEKHGERFCTRHPGEEASRFW